MDEKQINKWLRRRFSQVGWVLMAYSVILNILVTAVVAWDAANRSVCAALEGNFDLVPDMTAIANNAWGYILAIAVGLFLLHTWKGSAYWRQEIFVKGRPMTAGVFFGVVSLCAGAQLVNSLWIGLLELIMNQFDRSLMPLLESVSGTSDTFSMFLYMAFLAPISEEILFRGYALRTLRPYGKRFAILGSAFLFAIFHGNLLQTPLAFLVGLLLGYVSVEYSVIWAIVLHGFNNLVLGDLMTRLMNLLPQLAAYLIDGVVFYGLAIGALVLLLVNRQAIREYREGEWLDRRCLKCFFGNAGVIVLTVLMTIQMISVLFM